MQSEAHLSDQEILLALDGELAPLDTARVESHLEACWACRVRREEIEAAIGRFVRVQRHSFDSKIPTGDGPRALLKAQLMQIAGARPAFGLSWFRWLVPRFRWALVAALTAGTTVMTVHTLSERYGARSVAVTVPDPSLTPGATVLLSQRQVCSETSVKNKAVPVALERKVFAEYGIGSAQPGTYEVDYLITPALGGADDIRNLWPESSSATAWSAPVKDALEDHLRDLVCDGQLDLATAQREIAGNWIEAYKKYFHTDRPLTTYR